MFQIVGREVLSEWLARETDSDRRIAMLEWLVGFAHDPLQSAHRVPGIRAPVYIAVVPLAPLVAVKFLYAEQFRTIKLVDISPLP